MTSLPFLPTSLSGALADLLYLTLIVLVPVGLRYLRDHQVALAKWYDAQTTAQERAVLSGLAHDAVAWVERYASSPAGAEKFKQAMGLVQGWLVARGIHIDLAEVEAAIQDAYAALKTSGVLAAAGPTISATAPPGKTA